MGLFFLEMMECLNEAVSQKRAQSPCYFLLICYNPLIKLETKTVNEPSKLTGDSLTFPGHSLCLTLRIKEICGFFFGLLF